MGVCVVRRDWLLLDESGSAQEGLGPFKSLHMRTLPVCHSTAMNGN